MIELWLARDKRGMLFLFKEKPNREEELGGWSWELDSIELGTQERPDITWLNSPQKVTLMNIPESKIENCEDPDEENFIDSMTM